MKTAYRSDHDSDDGGRATTTTNTATNGPQRRKPFPTLQLTSNLLFVLASVLYLVIGIDDLRYSHELKKLPVYVRTATDDAVWVNYRLEERYNASLLLLEEEEEIEVEEEEEDVNTTRWLQFEQFQNPETKSPAATNTTTNTTISSLPVIWWADLPPTIQAAYAVLGYNETIWNTGSAVAVNDLAWEEMTSDQQTAATFLGYTQELWDATEAPTTVVPLTVAPSNNNTTDTATEPPAPSTSNSSTASTTTTATDPPDTTATDPPDTAATSPPTTGAPQTNGTEEEDNETTPAPTATTIPPIGAGYYDDFDWGELPPEVQQAAAVLGYNELLWDSSGTVDLEDYWWRELSVEQQQAAALLGYEEWSWDGTENPNATTNGTDDTSATNGSTGSAVKDEEEQDDGDDYVSYDDDYLFSVGSSEIWVSRYMVLYFSGALCFVFVGILDLIREKHIFHLLMIVAGLTGLVSAMLVEKNVFVSDIFNALSVHFFLLEAFTIFSVHKQNRVAMPENAVKRMLQLQYSMAFADFLFLVGSLLDVILSYFWLLDDTANWDSALMVVSIIAAVCWLLCSLIYISGTSYVYVTDIDMDGTTDDKDSQDPSKYDSQNSSSDDMMSTLPEPEAAMPLTRGPSVISV